MRRPAGRCEHNVGPDRGGRPVSALCGATLVVLLGWSGSAAAEVVKHVRYEHGGASSWGVLEGERIHQLDGAPWVTGIL